jgi:hypothetical protein
MFVCLVSVLLLGLMCVFVLFVSYLVCFDIIFSFSVVLLVLLALLVCLFCWLILLVLCLLFVWCGRVLV